MKTQKSDNHLSYGPYLRAARLEQDMQLKTVARKTCISKEYLIALEAEDKDRLPEEIFIKGFIRSYALAVGADTDEAMRRYLLSSYQKRQPIEPAPPSLLKGAKSWLRLTTLVSVLVGAIAFSVYAMNWPESVGGKLVKLFAPESQNEPASPQRTNKAGNHTTFIEFPQDPISNNHEKRSVLRIIVTENTWLRIMMDRMAPKHYKLKCGDRLEFEVAPYMKLAIGCTDNVQLFLNGQKLDVSHELDQISTLRIPL